MSDPTRRQLNRILEIEMLMKNCQLLILVCLQWENYGSYFKFNFRNDLLAYPLN